MSGRIRALGLAFLALYGLLFVQLNRVQFVESATYRNHAGNIRPQLRAFGRERGDIVTADGVVVARSEPVDAGEIDFRRRYPTGERYAHVVGFQSLNQGAFGLERTYDEQLAGRRLDQQFRSVKDLFVDRDTTGTVVMTLRDDLQRAAQEALGERRGSVVVVEPSTGAILAMWSRPSFDPDPLAGLDGVAVNEAYAALLADPADPLLAKAFREVYFPGSTFKLVTAAAALDTTTITLDDPVFPDTDRYDPLPSGSPIRNFAGSTCGGPLRELLRVSCNTGMALIGAEWVGPTAMVRTAENFGFNAEVPIDLPDAARSRFPDDYGAFIATVDAYRAPPPGENGDADAPDGGPVDGDPADGGDAGPVLPNGDVEIHENSAILAQTSIGQNDVKATPLQMAMVAAAIANDGVVMAPHVVSEIRFADDDLYDRIDPSVWRVATSSWAAGQLREAMLGVASEGTARRMQVDGVEVGGKTGTAQLGTDPPTSHAWVVGFAGPPGAAPRLAISVLVEADPDAQDQTGGRVAAPIAQAVIAAAAATW